MADCVVPSFTNPNNLSIVTGAPPACTASAATLYDTARPAPGDDERRQVAARADAARPTLAGAGQSVAVVTAKGQAAQPAGPPHVARHLLLVREGRPGDDGENGIDNAELVGKPLPSVYSADLSGSCSPPACA